MKLCSFMAQWTKSRLFETKGLSGKKQGYFFSVFYWVYLLQLPLIYCGKTQGGFAGEQSARNGLMTDRNVKNKGLL